MNRHNSFGLDVLLYRETSAPGYWPRSEKAPHLLAQAQVITPLNGLISDL